MKVYLVGIGMEGRNTLTQEAADAIHKADVLIGAERMLAPFRALGKPVFCGHRAEEIAAYLNNSDASSAAVLLSGDVGFFSGARKLRDLLSNHQLTILNGIASPVYFSGKIGIPWESMKFISLHGLDNNIAIHVRQNPYCFFLLGGSMTAAKVCRLLCDYGMPDIKVQTGENLGYPEEHIMTGTAHDFLDCQTGSLCVLVTENPDPCQTLRFVVPDEEFYDASVKEHVPITKTEVRTLAVASLEVSRNSICWDIGSGTGSVSVELAQRCPDGAVYSVDKQEAAYRLTKRNAQKFGCDHIHAFQGSAPEILTDFPMPDKVFIGGSAGNLKDILNVVYQKNPSAQIAVTAVTLETLENAVHAFDSFAGACSVTQLAVTRTRKAGSYTMLAAQNPVFLIRGTLQ